MRGKVSPAAWTGQGWGSRALRLLVASFFLHLPNLIIQGCPGASAPLMPHHTTLLTAALPIDGHVIHVFTSSPLLPPFPKQ
ncbi:MAG: hypothetical protein K6T90_17295 [Leptolyngbyaceae cyanobacterium HOT.MB2.61]|nr:hypothetical protein [Leptolyngbyaceae cyanobacterium HOT.MB2.61]